MTPSTASPQICVGIAHLGPVVTDRWDIGAIALPRDAMPEIEPGLYSLRLYLFANSSMELRVVGERAPDLDTPAHLGFRFRRMRPSILALLHQRLTEGADRANDMALAA